jgi:cysteinyl-tRNA synthetase
VKYWLHGAHLLVEGKKMSKSLGNFFTLRDLLAKGFTGREVRALLLSAHYRETFNFTIEGLEAARARLARLDECLGKLHELPGDRGSGEPFPELLHEFEAALDDDLNVSAAWGAIFEWVRETNRSLAANAITPKKRTAMLVAWAKVNSVLGLYTQEEIEFGKRLEQRLEDGYLQVLLEERQAARKAKDFKRSDAIRDELKAKGWLIEDTPKGPKLKRA